MAMAISILESASQYSILVVIDARFDLCDREQDYETVWAEFERRFGAAEKVGTNSQAFGSSG
jgi:hypothetical protein